MFGLAPTTAYAPWALTSLRLLSSYTSILQQPKCHSRPSNSWYSYHQLAHTSGSFAVGCPRHYSGSKAATLYSLDRDGGPYPSPAPPCPQTPGPGLAAFRTSPSLDWVSPVAPAENTVRAMQYLFFSLDFSSILPLNCTLRFYPPPGSPHCDLIVCLPSVRSIAPSFLINPYISAHVPHMRPELSCH